MFVFQTSDNSQLCIDSQYSSQSLTIVSSLKHKNTQPLDIFNRQNPQNSEPQNGPRRGLDVIALIAGYERSDASINELLTRAIESYESIIKPLRSDTG